MKLLLCLVLGTGLLFGQFEYGEILGTVRDASQGVVAGAKVTLRNLDTNVAREESTNEQGAYSFPGMRAGRYSVQSEKQGFRHPSPITWNCAPAITCVPTSARKRERDHRADHRGCDGAAARNRHQRARRKSCRGRRFEELPLNKRDYTQLVLLVPGTTYNPDQRLGGAISVNGNRTLQNDYLLDGVDNNSHATSFRGDRVDVILPSVDAVQEFRVQSNGYSAEYGHSAGAVVNVTIKNGTNQFHGDSLGILPQRRTWTPMAGRPLSAGSSRRSDSICTEPISADPIVKDKTFFFVNYEGDREHNGSVFQATVPTLALAQGNFANPPAGLGATLKVQPVDPTHGRCLSRTASFP